MSRRLGCPVALVVLILSAVSVFNNPAVARAAAPSASELKSCFRAGTGRDRCLDDLFREFLARHSTIEALKLVEGYGESDIEIRVGCHPIVHAVGRETFRVKKTIHDSFAACDQTCHSGCYHGAVERFLRGDSANNMIPGHISQEDLKRRASDACEPGVPVRLRFQCLHGLGHAVMYFTGYRLDGALGICDGLADLWSRKSCYGGVFMENLFAVERDKRDVSPTDYHYPCDRLDTRYRGDCYLIQTWRMNEMGLSTEDLFDECTRAGPYRSSCVISIGRDLSNQVRAKGPGLTARTCERRSAADRRACVRGVIAALVDNTWDGRYTLPFCSALTAAEDSASCFRASAQYRFMTFEASWTELEDECQKRSSRSRACMAALRRLHRSR